MNELYYGDNLEVLRKHIADNSVDLIYIDPPFNSKRDYNIIYDGSTAQAEAFKDTWSLQSWQDERELIFFEEPQRYSRLHKYVEALEILRINSDPSLFGYLVNMAIRIIELYRVLKPSGSFYLHCDPTASHYLKILLDDIFGRNNFRNEIVWSYQRWTGTTGRFQRMHDIILFYTKNADGYVFHTQFEPYSPKSQHKAKRTSVAEKGKVISQEYTEDTSRLKSMRDVWEISYVNSQAKERLGYPTQKPEALLERIINASSNEGDLVLDAFCGCGTTVNVAQKLNRRWIGIDITYLAIDLVKQRLLDQFYRDERGLNDVRAKEEFEKDVTVFGIPKDIEGAKHLAVKTKGDRVRKEFEKWAVFSVGGVYSEIKGADSGIDGYFYLDELDDQGKHKNAKGLIQVKSGKVGVKEIRDFAHVLQRENSPAGIFVTLENPTGPMFQEIARLPKWESALGRNFERISIVTVQDIFDEVFPNLPIKRATKRAPKVHREPEQNNLLDD